ncbi:MAG: indolepyruvate ferredoxin oxidoreductase subunit alpha, partial [Deltaproteobacteria bacterium]|nr:indolepyruvate ferredoxin oxidoreductase subunit alpha [Deltaproteobacteria bacterium]
QKVVSVIGDSTFFHSGIPGLINAVFNRHNYTLVILDNGTTAMTGHQPNPGVDMEDFNLGQAGYGRVSIEEVVRGLGVTHVSVIRPYKVKKSIAAIKEAIEFDGISVIISQQMCTLFEKSLKKASDRVFYVRDKCKNHRDCINYLGCPAFVLENDQVRIDPVQCSGCAVCAQVCPENAILPLKK